MKKLHRMVIWFAEDEVTVKDTGEIQKVVMKDEAKPEETPTETPTEKHQKPHQRRRKTTEETKKSTSPKTGDNTPILFWILLAGLEWLVLVEQ